MSQSFGRYNVIEPLAKGGMAQVYRAKTQQGRVFTLKKILKDFSDNEEFIKMFLEEAKLSLSMKHPNVIRVLDFGQIEGSYFLAMEYVFGRDLSAVLKRCAEMKIFIPIDVVCEIIIQCCYGLHYAHSMTDSFGQPLNIVHRDISPPNILVSYNGDVKILDFGIAKAVSSSRREQTRSGVLKGKFSYMSPEQASGKPIDAQSDVFSLGTVFYELLTSRNLFYKPDEMETLEGVKKADIPSIRKVRPDIPGDLEKIVLKALALKQKNRFQTAGEMAEAVRLFVFKNFPKSDSRQLAQFLRNLFSSDFETRSSTARDEGWQDVLQVGGHDDDLLLDQSDPGSENAMLRPILRSQEIPWYDRLMYDPHTKALIKRSFARLAVFVVLFLTLFFAYEKFFTKRIDNPSSLSSPSTDHSATPSPPPSEMAIGTLPYFSQQSELAESNGDLQSAYRNIQRALEISPYDINFLTRKNFLLLAMGSSKEPCDWLKKTSEIKNEDRILSEAICLESQGLTSRSIQIYSDFINRFSSDPRHDKVKHVLNFLRAQIEP